MTTYTCTLLFVFRRSEKVNISGENPVNHQNQAFENDIEQGNNAQNGVQNGAPPAPPTQNGGSEVS